MYSLFSNTGNIQILDMLLVLYVCCGILISQGLASTTEDVGTTSDSGTGQTNDIINTTESTVTTMETTTESTVTTIETTTAVNDLWCYSCADTKRGEDCQTNIKTMANEAVEYRTIKDGRNTLKYAKRCSAYANFTYCLIETIENRGEMHSYFRDCSDGVSFSYRLPKLSNVHPDNQTTCGYTGQGYVICVRLCQTNFCNGPNPRSSANSDRFWDSLIFSLIISFGFLKMT